MGTLNLTGSNWEYLVYIILSLGLAYGFASWAIDSGSLLDYLATIVFFALAVRFARAGIRHMRKHQF